MKLTKNTEDERTELVMAVRDAASTCEYSDFPQAYAELTVHIKEHPEITYGCGIPNLCAACNQTDLCGV